MAEPLNRFMNHCFCSLCGFLQLLKSRLARTFALSVLVALGRAEVEALSLCGSAERGFPGNTVEVPVSAFCRSNESHNVDAWQAHVLFEADVDSHGRPGTGPVAPRHVLASSARAAG